MRVLVACENSGVVREAFRAKGHAAWSCDLLPAADGSPNHMVNGRERWSNQTDSGQNRLGPSEDRWQARSKTYEGIARAMAEQWTEEGEQQ